MGAAIPRIWIRCGWATPWPSGTATRWWWIPSAFNDKTWLNGQGLPHSDQLHVTERYQRPDLGHLSVDITLDDPKAFTKPHTFNRTYTLLTDWEIHEYVCNEFNVDAEHLVGK